ncbi:MAG TPA: hypothetical protein VFQ05_06640 [Candidatus Eisenbacteria bacterium]|nr:hypothetical protein [Candidatus Eisenbacteria bacterium]
MTNLNPATPRNLFSTAIGPHGVQHIDARVNGPAIDMTLVGAFLRDQKAVWRLRAAPPAATELFTAMRNGTFYGGYYDSDSALVFRPEHDGVPVGILARVDGLDGDEPRPDRTFDLTLDMWAQLGAELLRLVPAVGEGEELPYEDFHLCSACDRPVFDSEPTMLVGASGVLAMVCAWCASGESAQLADALDKAGVAPGTSAAIREVLAVVAAV